MPERPARRRAPLPRPPSRASRTVLALLCAVWTTVLAVAGASAALPGQVPGTGSATTAVPERALPAPRAVHTPAWVRVHAPARERADGYAAGDAELAPAAPPDPGEAPLSATAAVPSGGPEQAAAPGRLLERPRQERAPPGTSPGPWSARGPPPARSS
ncbi:hypothetical protein ACFWMQ_22650 [Streptomyces sp. NPDC058372]|uniref:hypothetical protein n=1 Tax=Streptomyces sp. NPDC058372 TaxID=3346464 RepID=UPI0036647687